MYYKSENYDFILHSSGETQTKVEKHWQ